MPVTGNKHIYYNLSIRVKADGFSFLVTEGTSGDKLLCREFVPAEGQALHKLLAEKLRMPELSDYGFSRVRIITDTETTSIPQQEFVAEDLKQLFSEVFPAFDEGQYELGYTHLPQLDIIEAYQVPKEVRRVVQEVYPDASVTNISAVILGRIATYCKRQQLPDSSLFAYTTPVRIFLFSISNDRLTYANSFLLDQPSNSLFYFLSVWKALNLNARKNHCYLAGEEGSVQYLSESLQPYLLHIQQFDLSIEI